MAFQAAAAVAVNLILAFFACGLAYMVAQGHAYDEDDDDDGGGQAGLGEPSSTQSILLRLHSQLLAPQTPTAGTVFQFAETSTFFTPNTASFSSSFIPGMNNPSIPNYLS
jgi:hypothetical protein